MKSRGLILFGALSTSIGCSAPTAQPAQPPETVLDFDKIRSVELPLDLEPKLVQKPPGSVTVEVSTPISQACLHASRWAMIPIIDDCYDPAIRCSTDADCKPMRYAVDFGIKAHVDCIASPRDASNTQDLDKIIDTNRRFIIELLDDPAYQYCFSPGRKSEIRTTLGLQFP